MAVKRLTMDLDYHDLAYQNQGTPDDLARLFDRMARAGFDATTFDCLWCGTALYHSRRIPTFRNAIGWASAKNLAQTLREFDPLAQGIKLGKERKIKVLAYYRLLEEAYAPFDGDEFFRTHPEYWWQSRDGMYRMVGYPCLNYPEVREHMMQRVVDLVEHGVDGFLFGLARTHIPYLAAYRQNRYEDSFGFNPPIVAEFKNRYGVDLSTYDHVEAIGTAMHGDADGVPFAYEHQWVGTESYDMMALRRLQGEGYNLFLREVRRRFPNLYLAIECGWMGTGSRTNDEVRRAAFRIDLEGLIRDGILDEYIVSMNYKQEKLPEVLLPRFQYIPDAGRMLTAWLNDFFSTNGGHGRIAGETEVAEYVDRMRTCGVPGAVIHEAAFLLQYENPDAIWNQIARLKHGSET